MTCQWISLWNPHRTEVWWYSLRGSLTCWLFLMKSKKDMWRHFVVLHYLFQLPKYYMGPLSSANSQKYRSSPLSFLAVTSKFVYIELSTALVSGVSAVTWGPQVQVRPATIKEVPAFQRQLCGQVLTTNIRLSDCVISKGSKFHKVKSLIKTFLKEARWYPQGPASNSQSSSLFSLVFQSQTCHYCHLFL